MNPAFISLFNNFKPLCFRFEMKSKQMFENCNTVDLVEQVVNEAFIEEPKKKRNKNRSNKLIRQTA